MPQKPRVASDSILNAIWDKYIKAKMKLSIARLDYRGIYKVLCDRIPRYFIVFLDEEDIEEILKLLNVAESPVTTIGGRNPNEIRCIHPVAGSRHYISVYYDKDSDTGKPTGVEISCFIRD